MILSSINRAAVPQSVWQRLERALTFLQRTDFEAVTDGEYPVCGDEIFAMMQSFHVCDPIDATFETHRKYIDIQYVLEGQLELCIASRERLTPATGYDAQNDVIFYQPMERCSKVRLQPEQLAVLFPWDAHRMVCIPPHGEASHIRKCVVKVLWDGGIE